MDLTENFHFLAAAVLGAIGIAAVFKAVKTPRLALAIIPILLGVGEFLAGMAMHGLNKSTLQVADHAVLGYISLALVVQPWYVPLAFLLPEHNLWRRKKLKMLLFIGGCLAAYFASKLVIFDTLASIKDGHLQYGLDFIDHSLPVLRIFLTLPFILPAFVSGLKHAKLFGVLILMSYLCSVFYFADDFPQPLSLFAVGMGLVVLGMVWIPERRHAAHSAEGLPPQVL